MSNIAKLKKKSVVHQRATYFIIRFYYKTILMNKIWYACRRICPPQRFLPIFLRFRRPCSYGPFFVSQNPKFFVTECGRFDYICFFLVHSGPLERGEQGGGICPSLFPLQILGKLTANLFHKNNLNY